MSLEREGGAHTRMPRKLGLTEDELKCAMRLSILYHHSTGTHSSSICGTHRTSATSDCLDDVVRCTNTIALSLQHCMSRAGAHKSKCTGCSQGYDHILHQQDRTHWAYSQGGSTSIIGRCIAKVRAVMGNVSW